MVNCDQRKDVQDMGIISDTFIPLLDKMSDETSFFIQRYGGILEQRDKESKNGKSPESISFWQVALSVIQASFGVQSKKNRERDFKQGNLFAFIVAALVFTALFVGILLLVVRSVLN